MTEISYKKEKAKDHSYKIILKNAKAWRRLYENNIKNNNNVSDKNVCIICLLFALELYLKAYLISLNQKYKKDTELRGLGHNFKEIFNKIEQSSNSDVTIREIRKKLDEYKLRRDSFNFVELRYPQLNSKSTYPNLAFNLGENIFANIFRRIEHEIEGS